jgi:hypothetical protein
MSEIRTPMSMHTVWCRSAPPRFGSEVVMTWTAQTASGARYTFDTEAQTVTRTDGARGDGLRPNEGSLPLVGRVVPTLGKPLTMFLVLPDDDTVTARCTSPVVALTGAVPAPV